VRKIIQVELVAIHITFLFSAKKDETRMKQTDIVRTLKVYHERKALKRLRKRKKPEDTGHGDNEEIRGGTQYTDMNC